MDLHVNSGGQEHRLGNIRRKELGGLCLSCYSPVAVAYQLVLAKVSLEAKEFDANDLAEEQTLNSSDRIKRALEDGPKFPEELAEDTGLGLKTVRNNLFQLRKAGTVEPTGEYKGRQEQLQLSVSEPEPHN